MASCTVFAGGEYLVLLDQQSGGARTAMTHAIGYLYSPGLAMFPSHFTCRSIILNSVRELLAKRVQQHRGIRAVVIVPWCYRSEWPELVA